MKSHGCYTGSCAAVLLAFLAACSSSSPEADMRPLPSYAFSYVGPQGLAWTVRCPLQSVTAVDNRDMSVFYNSDGTTKTLNEFCSEYDSSTRIPDGP